MHSPGRKVRVNGPMMGFFRGGNKQGALPLLHMCRYMYRPVCQVSGEPTVYIDSIDSCVVATCTIY